MFSLSSAAVPEESGNDLLTISNGLPKSAVTQRVESITDSKQISDDVLFDMFLIKVLSLDGAAKKAKGKGESGKIWSEYLQRNGFSVQEVAVIREIANEHAATVAPIHAKALHTIQEARKLLKEGKAIPPPPNDLKVFQEKRYSVARENRDKIATRLGPDSIKKIQIIMRSNAQALAVDSATLSGPYRQERFREELLRRSAGGQRK